jgi:4-hydroxy-tetrahydrodipicolinate synthase
MHSPSDHILEYPNLWTAMITPFLPDLSGIDFPSWEQLVQRQSQAGVGVLISGSTGEGLNLSATWRKKLIESTHHLAQNGNLVVPLMVGLQGHQWDTLEEDLQWLERLTSITDLLVPVPIYAKPGVKGQTLWFEKVLNHTSKRVTIYNVPSRAGMKLFPEVLMNLKKHSNFVALKEASGSLTDMQSYLSQLDSKHHLMSGDDALVGSFIEHGAKGLISVASNIEPEKVKSIVDQLLIRKFQPEQIKAFERWSQSFFVTSNPVPVKALSFALKLIKSPKTLLPLCHEDLSPSQMTEILQEHQIFLKVF